MIVSCVNYDCLYCNGNECLKSDYICVGDGYQYGCGEYFCYRDSEEYQSEYYKAVRLKGENRKHKTYKRKCKGKRIEYKDLVLYTDDSPNWIANYTEERTGLLIGKLSDIETRYDKIIELLKTIPGVMEYPDESEGENNG